MKYKKFKLLYISSLYTILFSSCTEVITLDYNPSNSQIVVEANVSTGQKAMVRLSKSINFDADNVFPALENATVQITDNLGNTEMLTEVKPGMYTSNSLVGYIGRAYSLNINSGNNTIKSNCTIPNKVNFDSLKVTQSYGYSRTGFGDKTKIDTLFQVIVKFIDPISETNYYRFIEYINGTSTGSNYIYDDRLSNGIPIERNLFNFTRKLSKGDTLTVEMECIQKEVYEYFNSFGNNRMGSSTPANPYTNLTGTTLGFFNAHTVERKQIVIK